LGQQGDIRITKGGGEGSIPGSQELLLRLQGGQVAPNAGTALLEQFLGTQTTLLN